MQVVKTSCPLDCWDQCALVVTENKGKIISIEPDPGQPVTAEMICSKGKRHLERVNHPQRLRYPLLKKGGLFKQVSWTEALQVMAEKIDQGLKKDGPLSLMHFYDGAYNGLIKNIESRFFSALGGLHCAPGQPLLGGGPGCPVL